MGTRHDEALSDQRGVQRTKPRGRCAVNGSEHGRGARDAAAASCCASSACARRRLALGVDRLDYTKGIVERLLALEHLLEEHPWHRERLTMVQIAAPSRTRIPELRRSAEASE